MRGFSEAPLLVAFTLLSSFFVDVVNGGELKPTVGFKPVRRRSVIKGLLVSRQGLCDPGFVGCEAIGCCPTAWNCCSDGNCCDPTTYCALASNDIIGCCDIGEICSGPVGGPTTIAGPPVPPPATLPPPPVPTPTTRTTAPVPVPTTPTVPVPVPTTPNFSSVPTTPNANPTQTTINNPPTAASQSPTTSSNLPLFNAAGQAQLCRPLLLVLVGILLAAIY